MYTTILVMFLVIGTFMCYLVVMLPGLLVPIVATGMRLIGLMLIWLGPVMYLMRSYNTGAAHLITNPDSRYTNVINEGQSGGTIIRMKKDLLNTLRYKDKRYRDMGEALKVAGHDFQIASETQFPTFPIWLMDWIDQVHTATGAENHSQLKQLWKELKLITSHDDLWKIKLLSPLLTDPEKRKALWDIPIEDLRQLRFSIYDGRTITIKPYLDWFENSNAYDVESIIGKTISHRMKQNASYTQSMALDIAKYALPIFIILIGVGVAFKFMQGG